MATRSGPHRAPVTVWEHARLKGYSRREFVEFCTWLAAAAGLEGAGLTRALDLAGQGLVPERLGGTTLSITACAVLAGLALARAGLRDWRGA